MQDSEPLTPHFKRGSSEAMQRENIADSLKYLFSIVPTTLNRFDSARRTSADGLEATWRCLTA